jgi:DNA-directed RNA polymerase specialized sigma54-like protein
MTVQKPPLTITPELADAIDKLRASREELEQTVREELLRDPLGVPENAVLRRTIREAYDALQANDISGATGPLFRAIERFKIE